MAYYILLAIFASIIGIIGLIPYINDILKNKTKPHLFSWIIWMLLSGIAFFAQFYKGGGAGAWPTGIISAQCALVVILVTFKKNNKYINKIDIFCLFAAFFGIILWLITKNPLNAVIVITLTDVIAFIPTFRKGYYFPNEETTAVYIASTFQNLFILLALESLNLTTILYPLFSILTNLSFFVLLMIKRK